MGETTTAAQVGDAADRLILDEAAPLIAGADVVVIGSTDLAAGASAAGARGVRLHLDSLAGESSVADSAVGRVAALAAYRDLTRELLSGAHLVLLRLPKSLDSLDRIARLIAANAAPDVIVIAGARLKYMSLGMNEVLSRSFDRLDASLARQKSRVLAARSPRAVEPLQPRRQFQSDLGLWVGAVGGVFAGSSLDIGTRAMLATFDKLPAFGTAIDLGCGSGILAALLKRANPRARVIATDASGEAVESASETMSANELDVEVVRDVGLSSQPDSSADLIVLNPPFHDGGVVTTDIALSLFADAARVLRLSGELRVVWNTHLAYKPALRRLVGPTVEVSRTAKFTVTTSTRSSVRLSSRDSGLN